VVCQSRVVCFFSRWSRGAIGFWAPETQQLCCPMSPYPPILNMANTAKQAIARLRADSVRGNSRPCRVPGRRTGSAALQPKAAHPETARLGGLQDQDNEGADALESMGGRVEAPEPCWGHLYGSPPCFSVCKVPGAMGLGVGASVLRKIYEPLQVTVWPLAVRECSRALVGLSRIES
jgi:hypothetical protein